LVSLQGIDPINLDPSKKRHRTVSREGENGKCQLPPAAADTKPQSPAQLRWAETTQELTTVVLLVLPTVGFTALISSIVMMIVSLS
jgi:hypothetical protein